APRLGLLAAGLVVIDPLMIFFGTEARPYALVQLLAVVHVAITGALAGKATGRLRVAWIVIWAILFYLHYTAALLFFAECVFWIVYRLARRGPLAYRWRSMLVDGLILGGLCLPAMEQVQDIFARRANWAAFISKQPIWTVVDWWPCALGGPFVLAYVMIRLAGGDGRGLENCPTADKRLPFAFLLLAWLAVPV